MRRIFAVLLLVGCGSVSSVPCGSTTCGPTHYCRNTCTCCGAQGGTPSGTSECVPIPAGCSGIDICACGSAKAGGACNASTRTVDIPCP